MTKSYTKGVGDQRYKIISTNSVHLLIKSLLIDTTFKYLSTFCSVFPRKKEVITVKTCSHNRLTILPCLENSTEES